MLKYIILALTVSSVFSALPLTCPAGEYLDANFCKPCMKNCLTCSSGTVCTSCKDRYFPYSSGASCELKTLITTANCVQIVDKAASPTVCSKCENNYWLKNDKTCVKGTIVQCKTWTDDVATETCTAYNDGFSKPSDTLLNCTKVHAKCLTCTAETTAACTSCASDSYLVGGTCVAKTKNCKTWDESSATEKCKTCETGYSVHPLEFNCYATSCLNQKCGSSKARSSAPHCNVNCHETNCNDCTTDAADACTECKDGYSLTTGKKCFTKLANCAVLTDETHCATCDTSYHLNADSTGCVTIPNCKTMTDAANCGTCKDGYVLFTNACTTKLANCVTHTDATHCTTCDTHYHLNADSTGCVTIPNCDTMSAINTCSACLAGYTLLSNACQVNLANCAEMLSTTTCKTCKDNFVKNAGATACEGIANCYVMSATPNQCTTCNDPYFVNAGKTACITLSNCKKMSAVDTCQTCETGYSVVSKNCVQNLAHCTQMATDTTCQTCEALYRVDNGVCVAYPDHCTTYSGKCTACADGYYLDTTENDTSDATAVCIQCTDANAKYVKLDCAGEKRVDFPWTCVDLTSNCKENNPTPLIGEAEQDCKACATGYTMKTDHTCEACDVTNCHLCAVKATCTECKFGYYLKDNACTACDTTCSKCVTSVAGNSTCLDCKDKYTFSTGESENKSKCTACSANCERCSSNTTCVFCSTGYYLKTADSAVSCSACSTGCNDCEDDTHCFGCNEGFYLASAACKTCVDNCKVCTGAEQCTTCKDGYTWDSTNKKCSKSTTSGSTGKECLTITDCIKCSKTDSSKCALCKSGSAPVEDKCSCDTGKLLIGGACVTQVADMPEDISAKSLDDLSGLVTAALKTEKNKATNTKNVLSRVKGILSADSGKTNKNAGTALQLLLSFSDTATDKDAQTSYESVLTTSCGISDLDQANFQVAFAAADKFMTTSSDPKKIYDLGFSTCLTNLLKKDTIEDISPMKLTNSEFTLKKFSTTDEEKTLELTDITATANKDFMTAVGTGDYYAKFQAMNKAANPFKNESTNTVTLSSKIVSLSVMSSGASPAEKKVTLADNKTFPIQFDTAGTSAKCGYYDTTNKKWVEDGDLKTKTCSFSHLTDFAIFSTTSNGTKQEEGAYLIQTFSILLVFIIALL